MDTILLHKNEILKQLEKIIDDNNIYVLTILELVEIIEFIKKRDVKKNPLDVLQKFRKSLSEIQNLWFIEFDKDLLSLGMFEREEMWDSPSNLWSKAMNPKITPEHSCRLICLNATDHLNDTNLIIQSDDLYPESLLDE